MGDFLRQLHLNVILTLQSWLNYKKIVFPIVVRISLYCEFTVKWMIYTNLKIIYLNKNYLSQLKLFMSIKIILITKIIYVNKKISISYEKYMPFLSKPWKKGKRKSKNRFFRKGMHIFSNFFFLKYFFLDKLITGKIFFA